ncbi:MAG: hypothetical protein QOI59_5574 [Gammaproteobacteria bacterium]|jgi:hypothetical protein|nr:hypothetical protein [Gammaproteobacteria bacterium]
MSPLAFVAGVWGIPQCSGVWSNAGQSGTTTEA